MYFDGKDISGVDLKSLRRNIGVVMQNGKLFSGDIFSNITISAPWLTMDEAWRAAELSGIADDIRRMPMGMHTIISEGALSPVFPRKFREPLPVSASPYPLLALSEPPSELFPKESGMSYALISGVQKIKLSGAEKRAFARWGTSAGAYTNICDM